MDRDIDIFFSKVDELSPETRCRNLIVQVVSRKKACDEGQVTKITERLVGDETAVVLFIPRKKDVDKMKVGAILELSNVKIDMHKGTMRLAMYKSSGLRDLNRDELSVNEELNMSLIEFEEITVVEN